MGFLGGSFLEFYGRIFWEEFFGRNFLGEIALKKKKILYLEMSQYEVRFDLLSQYSFDFYGELDFLTELGIVFYSVALLK